MNERIEHRKPIVGRDCERDGFFIPAVIYVIELEDGFKTEFAAIKCRGCCAETVPDIKWGWHDGECVDPSERVVFESVRTVTTNPNAIEGSESGIRIFIEVVTCLNCQGSKFKEEEKII
ncbi:MAG: hypothetical protein Q8P25_02385 [Candidatus Curtissbacteria bacterium]|nr:hypothetical protein [Candidatus Curtissbacteria bacterium]